MQSKTYCFILLFIAAVNFQLLLAQPILIVPGFLGSPLRAKVSSGLCYSFGFWRLYWLNLWPLRLKCLPRILRLRYDGEHYSDAKGVTVSVYGFGKKSSVKYIDPYTKLIPYYRDFIDYFDQHDVRAAPYDWRLAAGEPIKFIHKAILQQVCKFCMENISARCIHDYVDELSRRGYYLKFQALVEDMYNDNNGQKVTIVAHSMGGPVTLYFLNAVATQAWKEKYIHAFIPLAAAWSGGNIVLDLSLSGLEAAHPLCKNQLKSSLFCKLLLKSPFLQFNRPIFSWESTMWLLPNPAVWRDQVLVSLGDKQYSAMQYEELFQDFGKTGHINKVSSIFQINDIFQAPQVPVHCLYGVGIDTPESFTYSSTRSNPTVHFGDGDDTINTKGSEVCLTWKNQQNDFSSKAFPDVSHMGIVSDKEVLKEIQNIVLA